MDVSIRHINFSDAKQLARLTTELSSSLNLDDLTEQIERIIGDPNHKAYVAVFEETIVGYVHGFVSVRLTTRPFLEIGGLVVSEKYRNNGIGSRLVEHIENQYPQFTTARVRCNFKREKTHEFYLGLHFEEIKQQKIFERKST